MNTHSTQRHISVKSFQAKKDSERTPSERIADFITSHFGTMTFFIVNVVWFAAWLIVNINLIPGLVPFDPFPFSLLTSIVSLEAIFLAIIVLISQNRAGKIADVREEIDLEMDVITEKEVTKILHLCTLLLQKQGIDVSSDKELQYMLKTVSVDKLTASLEKEIGD